MGKKKKRHTSVMKDWPSDDCMGVQCDSLIFPLKKIIHEGYRLERLPTKQFTYTGYNIGKEERRFFPTPEERFAARWLDNETKHKRTLMDNVLMTVFQLGIEQGRRLDNPNRYNNVLLEDILKSRTKTIQELRRQIFGEEIPVTLITDDNALFIENDIEELDNVDARSSKEE